MKTLSIAQDLVQRGDDYLRRDGPEKFHEYATKLLRESSFLESFNLEEILKLACSIDEHAVQIYKSFEFSDLPLTLSRGEFCFMDLYFWRRRPTTIHNHHFSGAFMGLLGKNVDLEFSFSPLKKIGNFHELGELSLKREIVVNPGEIVSIAPLNGFIHQNHHQADLTVNLCFRTLDMPGESLSNYLYSGLRYTKDPDLLMRVERLNRLTSFGQVDLKSVDIDEAMTFLILNDGSGVTHPRFKELTIHCQKMVTDQLGISVRELLETHGKMIEDLEEQYE